MAAFETGSASTTGATAPVEPAPGAPALAARGLTKRYGARVALHNVGVEVVAGEVVGVIGPNGAGKTTLLSVLAGALRPDEGSVDRPQGGIGWVPQRPAVYSKLSVAENLRLFARLERVPEPEAAVRRMLDEIDLSDRAEDEVSQLSGGNRQRVNVAVGMLADPAVLALDEPSSALDPRQRRRLWRFLEGVAERGTAVVYSTHSIEEAERHSDRVLVLGDGQLLFTGSPSDLRVEAGPAASLETAFVNLLQQHGH